MRSFSVTLAATSSSIYDLIAEEVPHCNEILIQSPTTNSGLIYFGENSKELGFIGIGGSANLPITNLRNIYLKGTALDTAIILIF